ncbi:MAG: hypothetical protein KDJ80_05305 [Nitratireductor sp.]|nr:hypothetical protein [Nitratireductor sp.]
MLAIALFFSATGSSISQSCDIDRKALKELLLASVAHDPGLQDFEIGAFSDGRTVRIQIEYLDTGVGTQVVENSSPLCISVDRRDAARASMIIDAMEECSARDGCKRLPHYVDGLFRTQEVRDMAFYEEGDPALSRQMEDWCLAKADASAWMGRFLQVISIVQFHEIGHLLLHRNGPATFAGEAEADGFAAAFLAYADIPYASGAAVFTAQVEAGRNYALGESHPPAECRVEAFGLGLAEWYARYDAYRLPAAFRRTARRGDLSLLQPFLPGKKAICERYAEGFHHGVERASALLNPAIDIRFHREALGARCDATAD